MKLKIKLLNYKIFGGRRWYQYFNFGEDKNNYKYVGDRGKYRTESFVSFIHQLDWNKNDKIVDVGCNAGRYCFEVSKYVKRVVGVEFSSSFCKQAEYLRSLYDQNGYDLSNVEIINDDITKRYDVFDEATTVFMSKVLYHKNLNGLGEEILRILSEKKVKRIIVQGHTTQGEMGEDEHIVKMLETLGYESKYIDKHKEYPLTISTLR